MDDLRTYFASLSDEELESLFRPYGEEKEALLQQMEAARALAQPSGRQYGTPGGALLGGIGDMLRAYVGGKHMREAQSQRTALNSQMQKDAAFRARSVGAQPQVDSQTEALIRVLSQRPPQMLP